MSDFSADFQKHWQDNFSHLKSGKVLLAVSGGLDSMCMAELFRRTGIQIAVAHCNFGLRAAASDGDQELVRQWCAAHNIAFHTVLFDTKKVAQERKTGTQETARMLRYDWFGELTRQFGYVRVATAHHADDNAETLLINLCRGTGLRGLHGILPDNGRVIRPLLFVGRPQLAAWAIAEGVIWREDESNASDDYLRNAIRHNIVPGLQNLFPGIVRTLNDNIVRLREAEELYDREVARERKALIERRGNDYYVPVRKLRLRSPLSTICMELFKDFGFSVAQIPEIITLIDAESGKYISSTTHRLIRDREFLIVTSVRTADTGLIQIEGCPAEVEAGGYRYAFRLVARPASLATTADELLIDPASIKFPLLLRRRRTGDYFYPFGMGMKKKKVGRLLTDMKTPLHEKENIWVVESKKRLLWVAGIRSDERFRVGTNTDVVLQVIRKRVDQK